MAVIVGFCLDVVFAWQVSFHGGFWVDVFLVI